ncbi:PadR family transcriptional regulator [Pseudolysinimonas sp.]|uniref:PadR family transcriptional regulator n=1 Tax=Pseudolysinimonas sp. TaxID=2680009 RepID=UPI003F7EF16D
MRTSSSGFELPEFDLRRAVDGIREAFTPREADGSAPDVRAAILLELATEPMHGYQLIRAIEMRSAGTWSPMPGQVYPTLQLLADEGLATATQDGERKVWSLTDAGRAAASAHTRTAGDGATGPAAASTRARGFDRERDLALPRAGARLAQAVGGFGPGASDEQRRRAVEVIDEARRKLHAILAED